MIGKTIAHYRIVERLGGGGMGVVYRAEDVRLKRTVACKFLPQQLRGNAEAMARFRRETLAVSALNHPNICTLFDVCEDAEQPFMVMELLEGRSLHAMVSEGPLDADSIIRIGLQVASALEAAHAKGIVHRDIKPANVFVTDSGQVKVLDFGLAKLEEAERSDGILTRDRETVPSAGSLTLPGMPMGTAAYMSPEQVSGEEVDARSDVFSFGAVLYEMATGRPAFEGPTVGVIFGAILHRAPLAPRVWNRDLPFALQEIILRALEKDPAKRHQSVAELRIDLQRLQEERASARLLARVGGGQSLSGTGIAVREPGETDSRVPAEGAPVRYARPRLFRRLTLGIVFLLSVVGALLFYRSSRAQYLPCVVIGELRADPQVAEPGLLEFVLKRALSQFPGLAVYSRDEFALALRLEKKAREAAAAQSDGGVWRRLAGPREIGGPTLSVSGEVRPSMGALELALELSNRGHAEVVQLRYRGLDQFLSAGVDELARRIAGEYDPALARTLASRPEGYRPAVALLSRNLDALRHYWRGAQAWNHLEMGLAEYEFRSSLEIDPTFALARLLLGEVRVFQNQWNSARSEILAAREQTASLTETDLLRLNALLARVSGDTFEERVQLQKLIGLQPHRKEYVYELAESYFHTADADEAIAKYREALALDEHYALAYNHLGYCYAWKGDHARALDTLSRYLQLDPSPNAYDSLGDAYLHAGEYRRAAEVKSRAVELDPRLYYAKRSLVYVDIFSGRSREARARAQKYLAEADDGVEKARFLAALSFVELESANLRAAAESCDRGLQMVSDELASAPSDELIWLRGLIALARGDRTAAGEALARLGRMLNAGSISAMNFKPAYKYHLHLAAAMRAEEGRSEETARLLSDLHFVRDKLGYWSTPYDCAFFMDGIGKIYERVRAAEQAERAYREALEYNPNFAAARFHLGRLLWSGGRRPEAQRELEQFLAGRGSADSDDRDVRLASQLLSRLSGTGRNR